MRNRTIVYFIGLSISALGIALVIRTSLGTGPWDTVGVGLNNLFGLTIGTWVIVTQSTIIFITAMIEKKRPKFEAALVIVVRSWILDFWYYIILAQFTFSSLLIIEIFIFILGFICIGFGIGIYIEARFPYSPLDHLMIVMSDTFHMSMHTARRIIELVGMIIGFFIGGPVGIGTIIIALFLGNIIQVTNNIVKKLLEKINITLIKEKRIGV